MQEKIRTIHVYFEEEYMYEEEENPIIEADPAPLPAPEHTRYKVLGICCMLFLVSPLRWYSSSGNHAPTNI